MSEQGLVIFINLIASKKSIEFVDFTLDNWDEVLSKAHAIRRFEYIELPLCRTNEVLIKRCREIQGRLHPHSDPPEHFLIMYEEKLERIAEISNGVAEWKGKMLKNDPTSYIAGSTILQIALGIKDDIINPYRKPWYQKTYDFCMFDLNMYHLDEMFSKRPLSWISKNGNLTLELFRGWLSKKFHESDEATTSSVLKELKSIETFFENHLDILINQKEGLIQKVVSLQDKLEDQTAKLLKYEQAS